MQEALFRKIDIKHKQIMQSPSHHVPTQPRNLTYNRRFQSYLDEITKITGVEIQTKQRELLKEAIDNNEFTRLPPSESKSRRVQFTRVRDALIKDWELNTGSKWNTYQHDVINKRGRVIRMEGKKWDAHEIILNSWGSPHEWFNLTPAPHPRHQQDVHGKNSICTEIFGR